MCLFTFLSIGLIGCGKKNDSGDKPDNPDPKPPVIDPEPEPEPEPEKAVKITSPAGTVYSCKDYIVSYLNAPESDDVAKYTKSTAEDDQAQSVVIEWTDEGTAKSYTVEYGLKADFSDAIKEELGGSSRRLKVYNLYKASTYHVRVTAVDEDGTKRTSVSSFDTQKTGPRVMKIGGIINVRDIGGYTTEDGKTVKQGLIFRGSCMSASKDPAFADLALSDEGKKYMQETLKIKSDFDLRWDALYPDLTQSPIPGAKITFFGISGYADAFTEQYKENYRKLFSAFANKDNYPVYVHCDAGADRTGTAMMILEYLLGMKWEDIKHDYEFTSFSRAGLRSVYSGPYVSYINNFTVGFEAFEGDTYAEKAENYLLSIGVTSEEIASIRSIMCE